MFGNVAASEVHLQPHILMFSKGNKLNFAWQGPLIFVAQL